MKQFVRIALIVMVFALSVACSKPPVQEIDAAKAGVKAVKDAGADRYAPEIGASVDKELAAALAEVQVQDAKFIKNYDKAKGMFTAVAANAANAKTVVEARKQTLLTNANNAKGLAESAIMNASALMEQAPTGKGTQEDIEALKADILGLQELMPSVQQLIDEGNYAEAETKAASIKTSAENVSAQISAAIDAYNEAMKAKASAKPVKGKK